MRETKTLDELIAFVPDIEDNRTDPEPFVCWLNTASHAEITKMDEEQLVDNLRGKANVKRAVKAVSSRRDRIIVKYVERVENYAITDKKGVRHVPTTGAELVAAFVHADPDEAETVKSQLEQAIQSSSVAREGLLGNLNGSQQSS